MVGDTEGAASFVVTAGGAAAVGLRRSFSPMVGLGEIQFFPGGPMFHENQTRVLFSFALALGR